MPDLFRFPYYEGARIDPIGASVPLIFVRSVYSPEPRLELRETVMATRTFLNIGMPLFLAELLTVVGANNRRIRKPDGSFGLNLDQLDTKALYGFCEGRRTHDARVQLIDAFCQIVTEDPSASHLMA
ncbi:hypothetical protein GRI72_09405 [Altererythrobacter marinus]|uniref:LysR substrate-binding domain-containing protein n=1 Tax=Pelagerythrobacter marinus TaxID=538382 RepID=A0ABW9UWQ5_9SPHN|nr:hypothetical protein [Pelagerythrobacter marinus]MXO69040.1 hypothetical protein [Pelagerythrobacter marinus]